jgi:hypothetical protein
MKLGLPYAAITGGSSEDWETLAREAKAYLREQRDRQNTSAAPPERVLRGAPKEGIGGP